MVRALRPKQFAQKKTRTGSSRSSSRNRAIANYNKKVSQANTLIDQGRLGQASSIISGLNAPSVQKRILDEQNKLRRSRELELSRRKEEKLKRDIAVFERKEKIGLIRKTSLNLSEARRRLREEKARQKGLKKVVSESGGFMLGVGQTVADTALFAQIAGNFVYSLKDEKHRVKFSKDVKAFGRRELKKAEKLKDPKVRSFVKVGLKKNVNKALKFAKTNPGETLGFVGGEVLLFIVGAKASKTAGKIFKKVVDLKPDTVKIVTKGGKEVIDISEASGGGLGKSTRVRRSTTRRITVGGVKEGAETLSEQVGRAGTIARSATSAQAGKIPQNLIERLRRIQKIQKPLPSGIEEKLSSQVRVALRKFDRRQLTSKQILELNRKLRLETSKIPEVKAFQPRGIDLLERSTYFDPDGLLRKSRLAVNDAREGTLRDLLTGKATLFSTKLKPRILIIDELIEKLPNTKEFTSIKKKLKANKALNEKELAILTRFQVTPSGKLKPIGSTTFAGGIEREVTIAPGEYIRKVKKLGTLSYGGKRIPIVAVKIVKNKAKVNRFNLFRKLSQKIDDLKLRKSKAKTVETKAKIDKEITKQKKKLTDKIKKKDRKEINEFMRARRPSKVKRVFPTKRRGLQLGLSRARTRGKASKRAKRSSPKRTPKRGSPKSRPRTSPKRTPTRTSPRPKAGPRPKTSAKRGVSARPKTSPKSASKKTPRGFILRTPKKLRPLRKGEKPYYIVEKRRGKLRKVLPSALTLEDAKDYLVYKLDNRLSRTAFYVPAGKVKKVLILSKDVKGYHNKNEKKVRPFKIKRGKKKALVQGFIEKRKYISDTRGEKEQLKRSRKPMTKAQRKVMLKNLAKARRSKRK